VKEILEFIDTIEDKRQQWKVEHILKDIVVIVLLGTLCDADSWTEMELWAEAKESLLRKWLKLPNGIPSHDTIERVMKMIKPAKFQELLSVWGEILSRKGGGKIKAIMAIDGKTIRGSGNRNVEALHVVSVWSRERGVCFGGEVDALATGCVISGR
jgi:hypothetical protein